MLDHELRYYHPDGTSGEIGPWSYIDLLYGVNGIGEIIVKGPLPADKPRTYFKRWGTLEFWRIIDSIGYLEGERNWRLQYRRVYYTKERERMYEIRFLDDNHLLKTRGNVNWLGSIAGTATAPADDMLKQMVREQLDGSASASRLNAYVSVAANTSQGTTLTWPNGYRNLFTMLTEVCDQTKTTTPIFFDMVRTTPRYSEFRTYSGQRGSDRGFSSPQPFIINLDGNLISEPSLEEDWRTESNYIYAMGQGEGSNRNIQHYPASYPANPLELAEYFLEANDIDAEDNEDAKLLAAAQSEYERQRVKPYFSAKVSETPELVYGRDFHYGDKLAGQFEDFTADVHISTVRIVVDADNKETLDIGVNNYE